MEQVTLLELVRKAITSRVRGCCDWTETAAQRVRERSCNGLSPEYITELLQDYVCDHPEAVTARRESREEYRGVCEFWFRVILPVDEFTHGLFIEIVLEDDDRVVPSVVIVNAHEQRP
jgi:hypothetical protein